MDNFGLELVLVGIAFVASLWAADVTAMIATHKKAEEDAEE